MRRRELLTLIGVAAAWPIAARAQQRGRVRRVGILDGFDDTVGRARVSAFRAALEQLGWSEGRNILFDYRWGAGDARRIQVYAEELIKLKPDVILAAGIPSVAALFEKTRSIPIVMSNGSDPVVTGYASSLARPGGNFTGFINFEFEMAGKWLELLKEIAPQITRVAIVHNPENPTWPGQLRAIEAVVSTTGVQLNLAGVHNAVEIEDAIASLGREPNGGLMILPVVVNAVNSELIIALAAKYRMPAVYTDATWAKRGGLLAYGIDYADIYKRAASYVDRILNGETAGDLPVQLPTKFELVINLKTAKALNLNVPPTLLVRADEVIE
jgi:putative ABC transport system substrate-binding protein